jgi:hypothetical protein
MKLEKTQCEEINWILHTHDYLMCNTGGEIQIEIKNRMKNLKKLMRITTSMHIWKKP